MESSSSDESPMIGDEQKTVTSATGKRPPQKKNAKIEMEIKKKAPSKSSEAASKRPPQKKNAKIEMEIKKKAPSKSSEAASKRPPQEKKAKPVTGDERKAHPKFSNLSDSSDDDVPLGRTSKLPSKQASSAAVSAANKTKKKKKKSNQATKPSGKKPALQPITAPSVVAVNKTKKKKDAKGKKSNQATKPSGKMPARQPTPPHPAPPAAGKKRKSNEEKKELSSSATSTKTKKKKKSKTKTAAAPSNANKSMPNDDYDSDHYDSDYYDSDHYDSDHDRKESSRVVVEPTTLSPLEDFGKEVKGKLKLRVKTLRGENLHFTVDASVKISRIRQLYWNSHPEWGQGPPHEAINFICDRTHYFLADDRSLSDLGIRHGSTLLLVVGSSSRLTGGWPGPHSTNSNTLPVPHKNIYRVSDRFNHDDAAPPAAAGPTNDDTTTSATATATTAPSEESSEYVTANLPSFMDVHAIVNTSCGSTAVKDSTITHSSSLGATYQVWANVPSEFAEMMDVVESHLPSCNDRCDLAFKLCETKMGQGKDLPHVFGKIKKIRVWHPHVYLSGVIVLHRDDPVELERALHVCNSLKRGQSFGEWFGQYKQLDRYQFIELGERLNGATLIYFSTQSFASCQFGDKEFKNETKGMIYRSFPLWNDRDKEILTTCINNHGGLMANYPLHYDIEKESFQHYCYVLLYAFKVGRYSEDQINSIESYIAHRMLWANGFVSAVGYTTIESITTELDERKFHNELNNRGLHVSGEIFLPPTECAGLSDRLTDLLNGNMTTKSRAFRDIMVTPLNIREWVRKNYMTYNIILECFKEGAIFLTKNKVPGKWNWSESTEGEGLVSQIPADLLDEVEIHFNEDLYGPRGNKVDTTTELTKDIYNTRNAKYLTVRTTTQLFQRPSPADAISDFIEVFGEDCYNIVMGVDA